MIQEFIKERVLSSLLLAYRPTVKKGIFPFRHFNRRYLNETSETYFKGP